MRGRIAIVLIFGFSCCIGAVLAALGGSEAGEELPAGSDAGVTSGADGAALPPPRTEPFYEPEVRAEQLIVATNADEREEEELLPVIELEARQEAEPEIAVPRPGPGIVRPARKKPGRRAKSSRSVSSGEVTSKKPDSPNRQGTPAKEVTPATPTAPESDEALFARIFPQQAGKVHAVVVPFFIDDLEQSDVLVESQGKDVWFVAAPLLEALEEHVEEKVTRKLRAAVDRRGRLSLESVRSSGLDVTFDASSLELRITTPPDLRIAKVHNVHKQGALASAKNALRPNVFSGYLNARGAERVVWSTADGKGGERQPFNLALDGALQWRGWVLEGRADVLEADEQPWQPGSLLLSRDDPSRALRYLIGDFNIPVSGFQPSIPVAGLGVVKNFALQPYVGTRPTGRFEFFLENPSEVTVHINGVPLQTLKLPAGHHDIRNLPMATGVNDVKLIIRDENGITRELSFRTGTAGELLAPGRHQFAYSLGAPLLEQDGARQYEFNKPVLSLWHRAGLTDTLTLGGYLHASIPHQLAGSQFLLATRAGNIGFDAAGSYDATTGTGFAFALRYEYLWTKAGGTTRKLSVQAEHQSDGFLPLGGLTSNLFRDDVLLSYGQRIGSMWQADLSLRYQAGRNDVLDAYTATSVLTRSFKNGFDLALFASARQGGQSPNEARAMLTARWALPKKGQAFHLLTRTSTVEEGASQIAWTYQGRQPAGAVSASASFAESANHYEATGLVGYTGQRVQASMSSTTSLLPNGAGTEGVISAEASTALVFAGGYFALSRPVSGAFAIVAPNETVRGHRIAVNPGPYGDQAWTDWLGPAVIPNLQPYHVQNIKLDAPDLPAGYSLGADRLAVLPSYKSGTLILTGEEGTVSLRGELRFPDGTPVALAFGELVPVGPPERQRVFLFTNRAGRFGLEAVVPGKYEIRLLDTPPVALEIPAGHRGGYSVGALTVDKPLSAYARKEDLLLTAE